MKISAPGFWRRLVSMIYESLLLAAILFIAGFVFHLIFRDTSSIFFRPAFQLYLLLVAGTYFSWFWTHGGQTLPMQTWKFRVISTDGKRLSLKQAIARYLFAVIGIFFFGCGILWALFDRNRQFLHDRLAGTQLVKLEDSKILEENL
ncbi:RDD family protein [Nitrosospira sp. NpAV]|uniref:RDD family protein n=1 Tax=Nitrosospira sp. NpAV TaxID=58133 RepID=UPI0005A09B32|nr:RDD family protein [Nitrosospira sp. NpAV]KIO49818.1 membrane protein [Nitrosospira sp. NpAV]